MYTTEVKLKDLHTLKNAAFVEEACLPLKQLGINYFSHLRIYHDRRIVRLANHIKWTEFFHAQQLYEASHILPVCPDQIFDPDALQSKMLNFSIRSYAEKKGVLFDFFDALTITFQNKDNVDRFTFGFDAEHREMHYKLLERPVAFYQFIAFFLEKTYALMDALSCRGFMQLTSKLPVFSDDYSLKEKALDIFLNHIKIQKMTLVFDGRTISVSHRQLQVLQLMKENLTAKEISKRLGLSYRTVQHYQQILKDKLTHSGQNDIDFSSIPSLLQKVIL